MWTRIRCYTLSFMSDKNLVVKYMSIVIKNLSAQLLRLPKNIWAKTKFLDPWQKTQDVGDGSLLALPWVKRTLHQYRICQVTFWIELGTYLYSLGSIFLFRYILQSNHLKMRTLFQRFSKTCLIEPLIKGRAILWWAAFESSKQWTIINSRTKINKLCNFCNTQMWLLEEFKHFTLLNINGRHAQINNKMQNY